MFTNRFNRRTLVIVTIAIATCIIGGLIYLGYTLTAPSSNSNTKNSSAPTQTVASAEPAPSVTAQPAPQATESATAAPAATTPPAATPEATTETPVVDKVEQPKSTGTTVSDLLASTTFNFGFVAPDAIVRGPQGSYLVKNDAVLCPKFSTECPIRVVLIDKSEAYAPYFLKIEDLRLGTIEPYKPASYDCKVSRDICTYSNLA